jgi:phage recombination protein Bet
MTVLAKIEPMAQAISKVEDQTALIKETFCKGLESDEISLFLAVCKRSGLDPFIKQIYAVKRKDWKLGKDVMTVQTSIDGLRLIADRTGRYAPGEKEPKYEYDAQGRLKTATCYVKKQTKDGTWHEIGVPVFYNEFVQTFRDKNSGELRPTNFWLNMGHNQLLKCSEAQGLRKAFPQELSQIYIHDEMHQAYNEGPYVTQEQIKTYSEDKKTISQAAEKYNPDPEPEDVRQSYTEKLSHSQVIALAMILTECAPECKSRIDNLIKKEYNAKDFHEIPISAYDRIERYLKAKKDEYQKRLVQKEMETINITLEKVKIQEGEE